MHFKIPKEQIAWAAGEAAREAIKQHASVGWNVSQASIMGQLMDLMAKAVEAGVSSAVNNMYTDEEFEKDLTL